MVPLNTLSVPAEVKRIIYSLILCGVRSSGLEVQHEDKGQI